MYIFNIYIYCGFNFCFNTTDVFVMNEHGLTTYETKIIFKSIKSLLL